jgi:integrase
MATNMVGFIESILPNQTKASEAKRIGIDNLAPHDLRRSCAWLCHGAGSELEQIQFLLGHASVKMTKWYIGMSSEAPVVISHLTV